MTDVATGTHSVLRIVASEASYNAAANTSDVAWALYLVESDLVNASFKSTATGASVTVDGSVVATPTFTFDWRPAGYQSVLIASGTTTVTHAADGTKTCAVVGHIDATGTAGAGGATDVTLAPALTLTTLLRVPANPTSAAVARVSDTQHTVTWTDNPATRAPYTALVVQRWDNVTAAWATIATLARTAVTFTDASTIADRRYQYRVGATNAAGASGWATTATVQTTPTATGTPVAAKTAGSDITVAWADVSSFDAAACDIEIWHAANGTWDGSALATVDPGGSPYTHTAPNPAQTHTYRLRVKSNVPSGNTLYSTWATSNVVTLATPPNVPASLAPNGTTADAADAQTLTWAYSSPDSSPQSKFQIRHRVTGGGAWTTVTAVTSAVSSWSLPAETYANGTSFEWQVQTWGIHANPSGYSASAWVTTSAKPTATISTPSGTVTTSALAVAWAYYQAQSSPQAASRVTLLDSGGATLETKSASGTATTTTLATPVLDGNAYTVRVEVQSAAGLWSAVASYGFAVAYLPAEPVTLAVTYDRLSGCAVLTSSVAGPTGGVTVAAVTIAIQRRIDGGDWVTIITGAAPAGTVLDTAPTIAGLNEYRAIAYSALPSSSISTTVAVTVAEARYAFLSTGPGFATIARMWAELKVAPTPSRNRALQFFAGRKKPVEFSGEQVSFAIAVTATLTPDDATPAEIKAIAQTDGIVLWRDPEGNRVFGSISPIPYAGDGDGTWGVSFTVTEVDHVG